MALKNITISAIWLIISLLPGYACARYKPNCKQILKEKHTIVAIPISEKNPLYLGKPVKLGNVIREDATGSEGTAWTTNPTAFIMCDGMLIYRWNLDKYYQQGTVRVKMPPGSADPFLK